jgi:hypothetical protein
MTHKQVRLSTEELHELKHFMGALLALLSLWSLTSLELGGSVIVLLGALVAIIAFCFPRWVARIPEETWRWAGPVLLLVIVADFVLHLPEFIAPLVRMVVLLIIYRLLAPRNQREDLQVILLCLFCVVISGVLTVSLLFALQILLFTPLAMALLFVICLLDRGKDASPHSYDWTRFKWSRLLGRVWQVIDVRVMVLCGLMFALVVAVSTMLFILTPRFDFNQALPFLEISTDARSGFSEDVKLGDVTEIQENNAVALRIDVPSLDAVSPSPYWRMLVLDKYIDGGFSVSQSLRSQPWRVFDQLRILRSSGVPLSARSGGLWTFYMEGGISRYLPVPGDFGILRFQKEQDVENLPDLYVYGIDSVGQNVFSYQIEGLSFNIRFRASQREVEVFSGLPVEVDSQESLAYPLTTLEMALSEASISRLSEINAAILGSEQVEAADYSQRVTDYLWQRFAYSLQPDGMRSQAGDPVVAWLENGSRGHCELFAGAFVLLARQAGYPARMVVGFAGGSWNSVENYFVVRNRDAHAWVEIYDAQAQEWLRVDPTPGRGSSDPEVQIQSSRVVESGWTAWVDSLRIQWYRRVINFEQQDQVELALALKDVMQGYADAFKSTIRSLGQAVKEWIGKPLSGWSAGMLALVITFFGSVYLMWRLRDEWLGLLYRLLRRPKMLDPIRRKAGRYLRRMHAKGIESEVVAQLQALRFGPESNLKESQVIFAKARRVLKSGR